MGGVFSQCFENDPKYPLETFQDTKRHFIDDLNIKTHYVPVHPNGSAEMNAEAIKKWLDNHPDGKFVAFGHSKGGFYLMRAFATRGFPARFIPGARNRRVATSRIAPRRSGS